MQLSNNQKGFAVVEVVLGVLLVAAIGTAGYFAYKNHQLSAKTSTSGVAKTTGSSMPAAKVAPSTSVYTDPAGLYTLSFPTGWQATSESLGSGAFYVEPAEQAVVHLAPKGHSPVVDVMVYDTLRDVGYGITDFGSFEKADSADAASNGMSITDETINNQPAFYESGGTNGSNELQYFIGNGSYIVEITMLKHSASGDPSTVDNSQYTSQFSDIAHSLKILK